MTRQLIHIRKVLWVLSLLVGLLSFALCLPLLVSLLYGEEIWWAYLASAGFTAGVSGVVWLFTNPDRQDRLGKRQHDREQQDLETQEDFEPISRDLNLREGLMVVSLIYILLSLFGALPFTLSGTLQNYTDAVFETASGFTTTGATILGGETAAGIQNPAIEDVPKSLLFWRSLSHWLGGMGIIVLSIAILPLLNLGGMKLFSAESSMMMSDRITPRVQDTAKQLWGIYVAMTAVHFGLLWAHPSVGGFDALNHAMSTLATGGFSTKNASVGAFASSYVDILTTVFMFLGGVNFVLHMRLFRGDLKSVFEHAELRFYALITFLAITFVSLSLWIKNGYSIGDAFQYGAFQVVSILTTTGFATDDYELWNSFGLFLLFLLFFIGGSAGSTSGGIKVFRIMVLLENAKNEFRRILHPNVVTPVRLGQKVVDNETQRTVLSFVVFYLALFGLGALIMSALGYDFMSAVGASIASLGSVGPAIGDFGPMDSYAGVPILGKWVLLLMMVIGRLELFTLLILFTATYWRD